MNKVLKIAIILIMIFTIFTQISSVYAGQAKGTDGSGGGGQTSSSNGKEQEQKTNWGDIFGIGNNFIKQGSDAQNTIDEEQLRTDASSIFKILLTIGIVLSVIIGGILGIKFMLASAEDKAQIKEMLIPYVVGCVVIYGAVTIWMIVVKIMEQI
jgi:hypothetical protein